VPLPVTVVDRSGERRREYALNLSPSGIGLHLPRPLDAGETLQIGFALPGGSGSIEARARVVWAEGTPPTTARARFYEVGVRFEVLGDAERRAILRFLGVATGAG
jgi:hypothetical protein